jgi:WD40 repeat protein
VIVTVTGLVHVYDDSGQKLLHFHKLQKSQVALGVREAHLRGIANESSHLFIGSGSGEILIFSISAKKFSLTKKIQAHKEMISSLESCFTPSSSSSSSSSTDNKDTTTLISADESGSVTFWSVDQKEDSLTKLHEHAATGVGVVSMSSGHGYLICSLSNGTLRFYSLKNYKLKVEVGSHTRPINAVDIHPNKPLVVAASEDSFISLWSLPTSTDKKVKNLLCVAPTHSLLTGVQFCGKDKSLIAATSFDSRALTFVPIPTI